MDKILFIIILAVLSTSLSADSYAPSHYCTKPYKPYEFTDQYELDSYNDTVQRYKNCIQTFVDEQNDAVRAHSNAAESAISEWNSFVRYN